MQRLFVDPLNIEAGQVSLYGELLRKVRTVLRMRFNDTLAVFDGKGFEYVCRVVSLTAKKGVLEIIRKEISVREPSRHIHVGQALPKSDKMTYIIQKAVELGAAAIHPFTSERSVPRCKESGRSRRLERWKKIAVEATQQSGRGTVPIVNELVDFSTVVGRSFPNSLKLILHNDQKAGSLRALLQQGRSKDTIFFLVGPEGGFSAEEISLARAHGFDPVRLGARTLRTETVALTFLSIMQYEFGEIC